MPDRDSVPRGRHAPPIAVRQEQQLQRLSNAAAKIFASVGYADATAEAIAREAGMSKATFYEHFDNKEDCIIGLFDRAQHRLIGALQATAGSTAPAAERYGRSVKAMLQVCQDFPDHTQTLLIEIIGAGPRAIARRDAALSTLAGHIVERNRADVAAGRGGPIASELDAYAGVGAMVELISRQVRTGVPEDIYDLEPVIVRVFLGMLATSPEGQTAQA